MDSRPRSDGGPVGAAHEDAGYKLIAEQVRTHFGLDLAAYRYEQIHRRLMGFARRRNVTDLAQYAELLATDAQERETFVHRFAINVSEFFRDSDRFETFAANVLPGLLCARGRLRIWSAGCSGGHEPYSLAILVEEQAGGEQHHIIATDIDSVALRKARSAGPYTEKEIKNVNQVRRRRHFRPDDSGHWSGDPTLRSMVAFNRHDLLRDTMPYGFDLIVCRNVLIYFTPQARAQTFARFAEALRPGGVLFVGATENLDVPGELGLRPMSFGFYVREGERAIP